METVAHHGRDTAYRHTQPDGNGPTTLYVHGSGGNHKLWVHQYAPTGPAHPAVAIDLSGHGESGDIETEPGEETLDAYCKDVVAVARETGADVLVGNSLGGAVVLRMLVDKDITPEAAVLAGTGAKLAVHESIRQLLRDDFDEAIETLHDPAYLLAEADETLREQSSEALRNAGQSVTYRDFLTCHEFDIRDRLAECPVPTLAVVGEHDQLTPPAYHEYLAEKMPACEWRVIEDAAHLAMLERPEAFNAVLESFLDGCQLFT